MSLDAVTSNACRRVGPADHKLSFGATLTGGFQADEMDRLPGRNLATLETLRVAIALVAQQHVDVPQAVRAPVTFVLGLAHMGAGPGGGVGGRVHGAVVGALR
jgi:hypothetical protein